MLHPLNQLLKKYHNINGHGLLGVKRTFKEAEWLIISEHILVGHYKPVLAFRETCDASLYIRFVGGSCRVYITTLNIAKTN